MAKTQIDLFAKVRGHEREEQLRAAREADLLPYFRLLDGPARPVVTMEGAERIMLGSNNYLGLTGDERVMDGARAALETYGTGLTGSRLLNGTIALHIELEREIAEWVIEMLEDHFAFDQCDQGYVFQAVISCFARALQRELPDNLRERVLCELPDDLRWTLAAPNGEEVQV